MAGTVKNDRFKTTLVANKIECEGQTMLFICTAAPVIGVGEETEKNAHDIWLIAAQEGAQAIIMLNDDQDTYEYWPKKGQVSGFLRFSFNSKSFLGAHANRRGPISNHVRQVPRAVPGEDRLQT